MSEWQSIETAPKDGTRILAASDGHVFGVIAWGGKRPPCWKSRAAFGESLWGSPTHWMPLPEPPHAS